MHLAVDLQLVYLIYLKRYCIYCVLVTDFKFYRKQQAAKTLVQYGKEEKEVRAANKR